MQENYEARNGSENILRQFVFIVFYYKKLILKAGGIVFGLALLLALFLPPVYISSTKFSVSLSKDLNPIRTDVSYDIKNQMLRILQKQKEIVLSSRVLRQTVQQAFPDESTDDIPSLMEKLQEKITVTPPKGENFEGSNVFYINVSAHSAEEANKLAKILSSAYLDAYSAMSKSKSEYTYEFFNTQVAKLYDDLQVKSRSLRDFEARHAAGLVDILNMEGSVGKTNMEIGPKALLTESMRNRQRLMEDIEAKKKVITILEAEAKKDDIPVIMADMQGTGKTLTAYRNKVTQLQIQINELKTQFTPQYEPLQQMQKELQESIALLRKEFNSIIKAKKIEVQSLEAQVDETDAAIEQFKQSLTNTAQARSVYESLKQDYTLARDAYSDARAKREQARLASSINQEKQDITEVEPPDLPLKPAKPNRLLLVLLGLFGGMAFGVALALTLDYFDHTLKTPEEIVAYLGLPCLGSVSHLSSEPPVAGRS